MGRIADAHAAGIPGVAIVAPASQIAVFVWFQRHFVVQVRRCMHECCFWRTRLMRWTRGGRTRLPQVEKDAVGAAPQDLAAVSWMLGHISVSFVAAATAEASSEHIEPWVCRQAGIIG